MITIHYPRSRSFNFLSAPNPLLSYRFSKIVIKYFWSPNFSISVILLLPLILPRISFGNGFFNYVNKLPLNVLSHFLEKMFCILSDSFVSQKWKSHLTFLDYNNSYNYLEGIVLLLFLRSSVVVRFILFII